MSQIAKAVRAFAAAVAEGCRLGIEASRHGMTVGELADIRAEERAVLRRLENQRHAEATASAIVFSDVPFDEAMARVAARLAASRPVEPLSFADRVYEDGRFYVPDDSQGRRVH